MKRLGSPAVSDVMIKPMTPNCKIRIDPIGKPMAAVSKVSLRMNLVCP